jgi:solute carrier family 25 phosphate transporter 3
LAILYAHAWHRTAIDVVKTRIQIDPALARHSLLSGGRLIVTKEGPSALLTGFGPTAVGYFVQGGGKFAGYELWKKQFITLAGDKETAVKYRTAIYLGAATVGESVSSDLSNHELSR